MEKSDFRKGQVVLVYRVGHKLSDPLALSRAVVECVGRRYITVITTDTRSKHRFDMEDDFREEPVGNWEFKLYLTRKDVVNDLIRANKIHKVENAFYWGYGIVRRLSDGDLDTVLEIIERTNSRL